MLVVTLSLWASAGERSAFAQSAERIVTPPPVAQILRARPGVSRQAAPFALGAPAAPGGEALLDLDIVYTDATIYNPGNWE
jgi:hypothetical protein